MKKSTSWTILQRGIATILMSLVITSTSFANFTGNGTYQFSAAHSDRFIEADGGETANGVNVKQWDFHGKSYMNWQFIYAGGTGVYYIKNVQTGKYLDVSEVRVRDNQNVHQWAFTGATNQQWYVNPADNGAFYIRTQMNRNYYLTIYNYQTQNGANVVIRRRDSGNDNNKKFKFFKLNGSQNPTGYYRANDGGHYYIRKIGNEVTWFGERGNGSWANVFRGTLNGNRLNGKFYDVPKGQASGQGDLILSVSNGGANIHKISGSFSGTVFTKTNRPSSLPHSRLAGFEQINNRNDLDGRWEGDNGSYYYIRQYGNVVVWFAEQRFYSGRPNWSNVAFGTRSGNTVNLQWADVPKGDTNNYGSLELRITGKNEMLRIGSGGTARGWRRGAKDLSAYDPLLEDFGYATMRVNGKEARGARPLLAIRMTFQDEDYAPELTKEHYHNWLFSLRNNTVSAARWFFENSYSRFYFEKADFVTLRAVDNPYTSRNEALLDCAFRREGSGCAGEWEDYLPDVVKMVEQQTNFNYRRYDTNGDKIITSDELTLIFIHADRGEATSGAARYVSVPLTNGYRYRGKMVSCQEGVGFATVVHELTHTLGTHDLYGAGVRNNARMTIMAGTKNNATATTWSVNLDPYHKMRLGWIKPRIYNINERGGEVAAFSNSDDDTYRVAEEKRPVILYDPAVGTHEYFMLEARAKTGLFEGSDNGLNRSGVAVWRVRTKNSHSPTDSYVIRAGSDAVLQSNPLGDDVLIRRDNGTRYEIHAGANNVLDSYVRFDDKKGHDHHVYVIGPPNQTPPITGRGRVWTPSDGKITSLYWSSGFNSKIEIDIDDYFGRENKYWIAWRINSSAPEKSAGKKSNNYLLADMEEFNIEYGLTKSLGATSQGYGEHQCQHEEHHHVEVRDEIEERTLLTTELPKTSTALLEQNFPNPVQDLTTIRFQLPQNVQTAQLQISTANGKIVQTHDLMIGANSLEISRKGLTAGIYFYSLVTDGKIFATKEMIVNR